MLGFQDEKRWVVYKGCCQGRTNYLYSFLIPDAMGDLPNYLSIYNRGSFRQPLYSGEGLLSRHGFVGHLGNSLEEVAENIARLRKEYYVASFELREDPRMESHEFDGLVKLLEGRIPEGSMVTKPRSRCVAEEEDL